MRLAVVGSILAGAVLLLVVVIAVLPGGDTGDERYVLRSGTGGAKVPLAITESALDEMVRSGSDRAIAVMVVAGSAFLVGQGTEVSVVDRSFGKRKVRVLEGVLVGRTGWVVQEWVRPLR